MTLIYINLRQEKTRSELHKPTTSGQGPRTSACIGVTSGGGGAKARPLDIFST
jgi:hypothetical protein